jgi:hypothetical protein
MGPLLGRRCLDNTSDASKPVSTATQAALDLKANLASPTFTGTVTAPALSLSSISSATTSSILYYNTTSKAITFGNAPSCGAASYTGGTSSTVSAGGANFRTGPGQVWNPSAQNMGWANSSGSEIFRKQINSGDSFFVPPGIRIYSYTSSFDWLAFS